MYIRAIITVTNLSLNYYLLHIFQLYIYTSLINSDLRIYHLDYF